MARLDGAEVQVEDEQEEYGVRADADRGGDTGQKDAPPVRVMGGRGHENLAFWLVALRSWHGSFP